MGDVSLGAASREEVARLLGRAAFGATSADLAKWVGRPYGEIVDFLLNVPPLQGRSAFDDTRRSAIEQGGYYETAPDNGFIAQAQQWWLERMRTTPYPLEERMTLFWHGHFATSMREPAPDVQMIMAQNQVMRRHALGNFRDLVVAMTLNAAMLEWLDGSRNAIPMPNENYARELMELFTLGKYPQVYTETDVRESARVLTGWTVDFFRNPAFNINLHDLGTKTVLGATITNQAETEYLTLIDTVLKQKVSPLFIAWKLVTNFAYAVAPGDLLAKPDPLVARVAATLRSTNWDIKSAMRTLLMSDEFRSGDASARRQLVRQPAEVVVGATKALGFSPDDNAIRLAMAAMGQPVLTPPNVGGWPIGTGWLSPATVLARYQFAVIAQQKTTVALPPASDLGAWATLLGMPGLTKETAAAISAFVASQPKATEAERQASVLVLLLCSPEWMVM